MNISVEGIEKILSDEDRNNRSENKKDINAYFHGVIV